MEEKKLNSASKVQYIKEKRVRIPDKRAKGYDKCIWAHSLVVHNLVNRSL